MPRPASEVSEGCCHHLNYVYVSPLIMHQDTGTTGAFPSCNPVQVLAVGIVLH